MQTTFRVTRSPENKSSHFGMKLSTHRNLLALLFKFKLMPYIVYGSVADMALNKH